MNITTAVIVLAKQAAIKGVKREMAAQGLKPQRVPLSTITAAAINYMREHHDELIAEAKEMAERIAAERPKRH